MRYTNRLSWIGRKVDKQALESTHAVKLLSCVILDLLASDPADSYPNKKHIRPHTHDANEWVKTVTSSMVQGRANVHEGVIKIQKPWCRIIQMPLNG